MRTIKFRQWENNTMSIIDVVNCWDLTELLSKDTVMQYTGIRDKYNVEIYEGDIIKDQRGHIVTISVIKFHPETAEFKFWPSYPEKWCEVIGNIYENPELVPAYP